ncbi:hypothetical protein M153_110003693 [Pseudoloma neurophilia]|uniref:Uncharacterized protein n=1 Tax=Pseudoloma neurophilia TaxID=146866 RepID=A0A0R0MAE6_9MICR|nr:hypothetical protein M153_110003693 [Pseudoloma neurophilia]
MMSCTTVTEALMTSSQEYKGAQLELLERSDSHTAIGKQESKNKPKTITQSIRQSMIFIPKTDINK